MNEKLKKLIDSAKGLWTKWSIVQKIILFGIIAAVVVVLVFVTRISAAPTTVPLFDVAITDTVARDNILFRRKCRGPRKLRWKDFRGRPSHRPSYAQYPCAGGLGS